MLATHPGVSRKSIMPNSAMHGPNFTSPGTASEKPSGNAATTVICGGSRRLHGPSIRHVHNNQMAACPAGCAGALSTGCAVGRSVKGSNVVGRLTAKGCACPERRNRTCVGAPRTHGFAPTFAITIQNDIIAVAPFGPLEAARRSLEMQGAAGPMLTGDCVAMEDVGAGLDAAAEGVGEPMWAGGPTALEPPHAAIAVTANAISSTRASTVGSLRCWQQ